MATEGHHFEETERDEDELDEISDAVMDFIKENLTDPHLHFDLGMLTKQDATLVEKYNAGDLTEEEASDYLNELDKKGLRSGNPRYDLAAAVVNKIVEKELRRKRDERERGKERRLEV